MKILDGRAVSLHLQNTLKQAVQDFASKYNRVPHLTAVLVGDNPASLVYVKNKLKVCRAIGVRSSLVECQKDLGQSALLAEIQQLNHDPEVDGFIVQLPLPEHIDEQKINLAIDPKKDVDGFHPFNLGQLVLNHPTYLPATPAGILELLKYYNIKTAGKRCVIIGRSHIVGMPMAILMGGKQTFGNATVTLIHSRTHNITSHTQQADILIAALGKANFITADMVKEGATVIDVGINRVVDKTRKRGYRLVGDVDFEAVSPKVSYITPVPGGVGPMTIISLIKNTLKAAELRQH